MFADVLTAICLVLVLEGVLPFLNPASYKRALRAMLEMPEAQLRIIGLSSMIAGVIILSILR